MGSRPLQHRLGARERIARIQRYGSEVNAVYAFPEAEQPLQRFVVVVRALAEGRHPAPEQAIEQALSRAVGAGLELGTLIAQAWKLWEQSPASAPLQLTCGHALEDLRINDGGRQCYACAVLHG